MELSKELRKTTIHKKCFFFNRTIIKQKWNFKIPIPNNKNWIRTRNKLTRNVQDLFGMQILFQSSFSPLFHLQNIFHTLLTKINKQLKGISQQNTSGVHGQRGSVVGVWAHNRKVAGSVTGQGAVPGYRFIPSLGAAWLTPDQDACIPRSWCVLLLWVSMEATDRFFAPTNVSLSPFHSLSLSLSL